MARKKKQPASPPVVNISLSEIDLVAKGTELANRMKQITALKGQAAEEAARFRKLIDEQIEIADTIASQIIGGTEARNQASLKANEAGELEVPEHPFEEPKAEEQEAPPTAEQVAKHFGLPFVTPEDRARIEAEKVSEGLKVPAAVAEAIAKNGGEVDLSVGKAKNAKASKAPKIEAAAKGKVQPPKAPARTAVTVTDKPTSCPDCGDKIVEVDKSGVYGCADSDGLGCTWLAVVESQDVTSALGGMTA